MLVGVLGKQGRQQHGQALPMVEVVEQAELAGERGEARDRCGAAAEQAAMSLLAHHIRLAWLA